MSEMYFPEIEKIEFEGRGSKNPFAFRYYDPNEIVDGRKMRDHLRFAMSYWHTLVADGSDMFGAGTMMRSWNDFADPLDRAKSRADTAFEFMSKLDIDFFCFHDRDIALEADSLRETNARLDAAVEHIADLMRQTGIHLLWNTSNLFTNPRYVHGAATSCNADVFAFAAAQTRKSIDIARELGAENFVFWGGREGYETLLNTDMALEMDNLARFFRMAVDYAKRIGFTGQFLIEPKPKEPTKHQYDFDTASVLAFLRKYGLEEHFKINIEANHATLAGHSFQHELNMARINGVLGSIDANQGDMLLGWDTDNFPTNVYDATLAMYEVIRAGGLAPGGLNFDAHVRRGSFEPEDLFLAYIAGMDTFARGFHSALALHRSGELEEFKRKRYSSYESGIGSRIVSGSATLEELEAYALQHDDIRNRSGRQEMLESVLNRYILEN